MPRMNIMSTKGDKKEHEGNFETTKVKAYSPSDSYDDIVAGKTDIGELDATISTCDKCGLTARNERELQDHISHAHTNQANTAQK